MYSWALGTVGLYTVAIDKTSVFVALGKAVISDRVFNMVAMYNPVKLGLSFPWTTLFLKMSGINQQCLQ